MDDPQKQTPPPLQRWLPALLVLFVVAMILLLLQGPPNSTPHAISYSEFKSLVAEGAVEQVRLRDSEVLGTLLTARPIGPRGESGKQFKTYIPTLGDSALLPTLERAGVMIRAEPAQRDNWLPLLLSTLPWLFLMTLIYWSFRRAARSLGGLGRGDELNRFLSSLAREAEHSNVTFDDVAGQENAKREVQELVDYLRDPDRFKKLGAEVPRGVLLMGPPGTGKTLLARALAGEAAVPFFSITGSEFIEVFVGVGASRVRNLFSSAKKRAPCIIFIDELDAVGRTRGTGLGGGHDEREQTLNQILAEMDGFAGHEAVIVLAATNRPDVLDPALLRPGRFDRHVTLDLPDRKDREAILKVHVKKVPLASGVDLKKIAATTPGFSGADLKNLVNEAAILSARDKLTQVGMQQFDAARDKVILGATRSLVIQPEERHRLAVHEAGHTVVAHFLPLADPLYKVSIIPRGQALGGTQQLPEQERHTLPEDYLRDRLAVMLGGRCAEHTLLGSVSSGADDDIRQATQLARAMVARWGMSEEVGPVDLRDAEEHPFLGREIAQPRRFSESSAEAVDHAMRTLLHEAEQRATETLNSHRQALEHLIRVLEEEEDLDRERIEEVLGAHRTRPDDATEGKRPGALH
jgi:cell division protease FtsH